MLAVLGYYLFALTLAVVMLFIGIHALLGFFDLENDYENPIDLARRLNTFVPVELICHFLLIFASFGTFHFIEVIPFIPLTVHYAYKLRNHTVKYEAISMIQIVKKLKYVQYAKIGTYIIGLFVLMLNLVFFFVLK